MADVSIVLCTRNRCEQLRQALAVMRDLDRPPHAQCEIVVVDNDSSDRTRAVIDGFASSSPHAVRYVFEGMRGLAYARNAGVRASSAAIIACTDDDCLVARDWIARLVDEFARQTSVGVIGGRVELHDTRDAPLATRTALDARAVGSVEDVFALMIGCNLAFRREVFDAIGGYDVRFGRPAGTTGDDMDFVYRALRHGFAVAYSPLPVVKHAHGRRTQEQVRAARRMYARGKGAFFAKHVTRGDWSLVRQVYWELRAAARQAMRARKSHGSAAEEIRFVGDFLGGGSYFLLRSLSRSRSD